jgi:hypothetical protein
VRETPENENFTQTGFVVVFFFFAIGERDGAWERGIDTGLREREREMEHRGVGRLLRRLSH